MVFTGILSIIFTKKKLYIHHLIAMIIVAMGLSVVAVLAEVYKEKDLIENNEFEAAEDSSPSQGWYIFLLLLGQFFMACQYVSEAIFTEGYSLDPSYIVGMEGVFCCFYFVIMAPFFLQV